MTVYPDSVDYLLSSHQSMITFQIDSPLRDGDNLCVLARIIGYHNGTRSDLGTTVAVYDEIGCYFNEPVSIFNDRLKGRTGVAAKRDDGNYRICYWT